MTDRSSKDFNQLVPYTFDAIQSYWVDTWQRSILMLDTLRQRGNIHLEQAAKPAPHVLSFDADLVMDGRTLARPVNYVLVRIKPPQGVAIDRTKRPFIVFDPRAGHGPGIGGMKQDSEIGVAMQAGHPCYFVGFLPNPMPGQTIEDVCVAEAAFVKRVSELEPEANGKPCVIGNCQAGWQLMLTASIAPELFGPDHPGRLAAVLLGRRERQEPDALPGRAARRHLADGAGGRSRPWHFRRRQPGGQFRDHEPGQYLLAEGLQRLLAHRQRAGAVPRLRDVVGLAGAAQRRGNAVDRRQPVRRQPPGRGHHRHLRRQARRLAQHHLADRRVLLVGRRHHAAAAGARLDPRSLRRYRRPRPLRPDHHLHRAPDDRPSRHLRLGQGRVEGAQRVRLLHRHDRRDAARPLRGGDHRGGAGHGPRRPDRRPLPDAAGAAHARRHPGVRHQRPARTRRALPPRPGCRRSTRGSTAPSPRPSCARRWTRGRPSGCAARTRIGCASRPCRTATRCRPPWRTWPRRCAPTAGRWATTIRCARSRPSRRSRSPSA